MVVLARRTSMTRTLAPATESGTSPSAVRITSMRTRGPADLRLAAVPEGADAQAKRIQVDEALRVALPIDAVGLEGGEVRAIERPRRAAADHRGVPLVE